MDTGAWKRYTSIRHRSFSQQQKLKPHIRLWLTKTSFPDETWNLLVSAQFIARSVVGDLHMNTRAENIHHVVSNVCSQIHTLWSAPNCIYSVSSWPTCTIRWVFAVINFSQHFCFVHLPPLESKPSALILCAWPWLSRSPVKIVLPNSSQPRLLKIQEWWISLSAEERILLHTSSYNSHTFL